jgi:hypothetical protein
VPIIPNITLLLGDPEKKLAAGDNSGERIKLVPATETFRKKLRRSVWYDIY